MRYGNLPNMCEWPCTQSKSFSYRFFTVLSTSLIDFTDKAFGKGHFCLVAGKLAKRLAPDFKTIADFRKDNGKAVRSVCRQLAVLCRNLNLFSQLIIAIDGRKFKAVNNRDRNFIQGKLKARMQQIEQSIDRYLTAMDSADRTTPEVAEAKASGWKKR